MGAMTSDRARRPRANASSTGSSETSTRRATGRRPRQSARASARRGAIEWRRARETESRNITARSPPLANAISPKEELGEREREGARAGADEPGTTLAPQTTTSDYNREIEDEAMRSGLDEVTEKASMASVIALIVGSTVGAGALALPAATAPSGIVPAGGALLGVWIMLVCDALLIAEVNLKMMRERDEERLIHGRGHSPVVIPLNEMAERTLGEQGQVLMNSIYGAVSLTILVAYINKAGDLLNGVTGIDAAVVATAFTVVFGGLVCVGGTKLANSINQTLTYVCLIAFCMFLGAGSLYAHWSDAPWTGSMSAVPEAIPIIFLTLVFHDLVPVVCSMLEGDSAKIRKGILIGSAIPLVMFELWDTIALAVAAGDVGKDPLDIISADVGGAASVMLGTFGIAALATSFIGCVLGISSAAQPFVDDILLKLDEPAEDARMTHALFEALDTYDAERKPGAPSVSRLLTFGGIVTVPLAIAASFPNIFLPLSGFVSAYGMTTIYGVMPPLMALSLRRESRKYGEDPSTSANISLPGGEPALITLIASAVMITIDKMYDDVSALCGGSIFSSASVADVADIASLAPVLS